MIRWIFSFALLAVLLGVATTQATGISYQPVQGGVMIVLTGVDSPEGLPASGTLHCVMGTRKNWASRDGGRTFAIGQMIGGCVHPDSQGNARHMVSVDAVDSRGVLCLVPVWVYFDGRFSAWSSHPDGATNHTTRQGHIITALVPIAGGQWRAATDQEAFTCD